MVSLLASLLCTDGAANVEATGAVLASPLVYFEAKEIVFCCLKQVPPMMGAALGRRVGRL